MPEAESAVDVIKGMPVAARYLAAWVDRSHGVAVLKLRGELDAVTADGFAREAIALLRQVDGPVAVDLSFLGFMDCAGAHTLEAVVATIPPRRLVDVCGIQPVVRRLLELIGLDLNGRALAPPPGTGLAPTRPDCSRGN